MVAAHQASTLDLWEIIDDYVVFISDIVIQEASRGDKKQARYRLDILKNFQVLIIDDEVKELARSLLVGKVIPEKCPEDALHIAVAAMNGVDAIVTWNFRHINNPYTRKMIRSITESNGLACPEICSPEELIGGD
ncbi:MAG: type II toxin-antitoxin system VapC family toxin [Planctomycetes bacterium]|nr:type II toxin-antitoxin system VapC family toxin [Planctomycetota bacterium]